MKLPLENLTSQQRLDEFDIWITPSLGEVKDTDRFSQEMDRILPVFDALAEATDGFSELAACEPGAIASTYIRIARAAGGDAAARYHDLAAVLFLVSGKSDNNAKCQLPIHLRDVAKLQSFPKVRRGRVSSGPIPRELKADKYMSAVAALAGDARQQTKVLEAFVSFVLSDESYAAQLWSVGRSYVMMKELGRERALLTPLVTFQVRGSVAASGGHVPEDRLRAMMEEWGLEAGSDFNRSDAAVTSDHSALEETEPEPDGNGRVKTRAYDFVLPFRVPGWEPQLLVQCQFYAGDSGSVSHKNVDQTSKSRAAAQQILPNARFIEYVDGAGYFSSLNGDLRTLFAMPTTRSYFQLRSAPVRLRRELQQIGLVTAMDVAHAALGVDATRSAVGRALLRDGYADDEVDRAMTQALRVGMVRLEAGSFVVAPRHRERVRQCLLLDIVAREGRTLDVRRGLRGQLLVPGMGPFHGLELDEVARKALTAAPALRPDWQSPDVILADIRGLCVRGFAMAG